MNLITITDVLGNTEILTGFKTFNRVRKVNGEKVVSFLIVPTEENKHAFPLVQEESKVEFDGETYVIKSIAERNIGNAFYKQVECIHDFFVKMIDKQKYEVRNGSMTLRDALDFVFEGTGYQTAIIDSFYAQDFENFGKDNRLSLLKKVLERYRAEMSISGNLVRFKTKIGEDTDFQFRYNFNIKTFERTIDTKSLATYIRGYGKDGLMREYTSPNVHIFGFLEAPMIDDERYTTISGLDNALKESLQDTPVISMTLDFIDLRKAGYPYIIPNEGDRVLLIYEPMNVDIETRIMEIDEEFNNELEIISSKVTLANYKKDLSGTLLQAIQKSLKGIVNNDGKIIYNALDEAVKRATQAIKNAETELVFENGILAINPKDRNNFVAFNSAGLGITFDGGNTFKEALTYEGLVASVGVIGQFEANNIRVGPETTFDAGYDPAKKQGGGRNILYNTSDFEWNAMWADNGQGGGVVDTSVVYNGKSTLRIPMPQGVRYLEGNIPLKRGTYYTYSAMVRGSAAGNGTELTPLHFWAHTSKDTSGQMTTIVKYDQSILDKQWKRVYVTFLTPADKDLYFSPYIFNGLPSGTLHVIEMSFQEGDVLMDWTANPDEVRSKMQQIRTDLRLTAPLPTTLNLDMNGITANTSKSDSFARLDYRGMYIKKGAIQIERADGYNLIIDGTANFDMGVSSHEPPFMSPGVAYSAYWYATRNTTWSNCNFFTFKHTGRYLVFALSLAVDPGSSAQVKIVDNDGKDLWFTSHNKTINDNYYINPRIDLGVPTGEMKYVYLRTASNSADHTAYARVLSKWQEG
ncbi:hypothetical protein COF61_00830 [Bacillus toyonensis]|uniref:phage tail spike protein n=1 Tax=Bacillus toyonensis TaxID=155322 RepID=UPI000BFDBF7D|nr:phage tail spike protein [Bacillus toyonensis]PHD69303.1 hypothetical protein COF61_00830 [Bacillus toyonensis]